MTLLNAVMLMPIPLTLDELQKLFRFLENGERPLSCCNHLLLKFTCYYNRYAAPRIWGKKKAASSLVSHDYPAISHQYKNHAPCISLGHFSPDRTICSCGRICTKLNSKLIGD